MALAVQQHPSMERITSALRTTTSSYLKGQEEQLGLRYPAVSDRVEKMVASVSTKVTELFAKYETFIVPSGNGMPTSDNNTALRSLSDESILLLQMLMNTSQTKRQRRSRSSLLIQRTG